MTRPTFETHDRAKPRMRRSYSVYAPALALLAAWLPLSGQAADPASAAVSFTPWNGTSIRIAEQDRRYVGTFSAHLRAPKKPACLTASLGGTGTSAPGSPDMLKASARHKCGHVRVDGTFSAPLDAQTREAAFVEKDQLISGFSGTFFVGYDTRFRAGFVKDALKDALKADRSRLEHEKASVQKELTEALDQQAELLGEILQDCNAKHKAACAGSWPGSVTIIPSAPALPNGPNRDEPAAAAGQGTEADQGGSATAQSGATAQPAPETTGSAPSSPGAGTQGSQPAFTQTKEWEALLDELCKDGRYSGEEYCSNRKTAVDLGSRISNLDTRIGDIDERIIEIDDRIAAASATERLNLSRRATGEDGKSGKEGDKYRVDFAVGLEAGGHVDRMRVLLRSDAVNLPPPGSMSSDDGLRDFTDWSAMVGARADVFLGNQHVFTVRSSVTGKHDVHADSVGLSDGRVCSELGPVAGPSVQDCRTVKLASSLGQTDWAGNLRLSYTLYARNLLPTDEAESPGSGSPPQQSPPATERGGVVPGLEAMIGAEDLGAGAKARLRATFFVSPTGDPNKIKAAGRFGIGLETLIAVENHADTKVGDVKLVPFGMVGAIF